MQTWRALGLAVIMIGLLLSSGCATGTRAGIPASPSASAQPTSPMSGPPTTAPEPTPASTAERPTIANATCDTMLEPVVSASLRSRGLSPAPKPWGQFGFTPRSVALECPWGLDGASVPETFFGWAQLEQGEDEIFLLLVQQNGYTLESTPRGVWIVAPPELDTEGSAEILVTTDWIAYAETRDGVDDIVWTK